MAILGLSFLSCRASKDASMVLPNRDKLNQTAGTRSFAAWPPFLVRSMDVCASTPETSHPGASNKIESEAVAF